MSRRPVVEVSMAGAEILATVARIALNPTCPSCGGPAELRPGPGGAVDLHVQHRDGCKAEPEG